MRNATAGGNWAEAEKVLRHRLESPPRGAQVRGCLPLRERDARAAFSLLEVMIACGIFFMCIFAILALVSNVLRNARSLRRVEVDAGMVAAQTVGTNKLYEGSESGDFGNLYPDYSWDKEISQVSTNGLFQVDIVVRRRGLQRPVDTMSIWVFAPDSPSQGFGRPTLR